MVPKDHISSTLQYLNFTHYEPPIIKSSFPLFVFHKIKSPPSTENGLKNGLQFQNTHFGRGDNKGAYEDGALKIFLDFLLLSGTLSLYIIVGERERTYNTE